MSYANYPQNIEHFKENKENKEHFITNKENKIILVKILIVIFIIIAVASFFYTIKYSGYGGGEYWIMINLASGLCMVLLNGIITGQKLSIAATIFLTIGFLVERAFNCSINCNKNKKKSFKSLTP